MHILGYLWLFLGCLKSDYVTPFMNLNKIYYNNLLEERTCKIILEKIYKRNFIDNNYLYQMMDVLNVLIGGNGLTIITKEKIDHYLYENYKVNKDITELNRRKLFNFIFCHLNDIFRNKKYILEFKTDEVASELLNSKDFTKKICEDLSVLHGDITYVILESEMFNFILDKSHIKKSRILEYFHSYEGKFYCTIINYSDFNVYDLVLHIHQDDVNQKSKKIFFDYIMWNTLFYSSIKKLIFKDLSLNYEKELQRYKKFLKDLLFIPDPYFNKFDLYNKIIRKLFEDNNDLLNLFFLKKVTNSQKYYLMTLIQTICICESKSFNEDVDRKCSRDCIEELLKETNGNFDETLLKIFDNDLKSKFLMKNKEEYYLIMFNIILFLFGNLEFKCIEIIKDLVNYSEREIVLFLINEFINVKYNLYYDVCLINIIKEDAGITNLKSKEIYKKILNNDLKIRCTVNSTEKIYELLKVLN